MAGCFMGEDRKQGLITHRETWPNIHALNTGWKTDYEFRLESALKTLPPASNPMDSVP